MLSVIIPVFNRVENVRRCLRSLERQVGVKSKFEVVVVDDGSTDGLRERLAEDYPNGYLREDVPFYYMSGGPNKGFRGGRARNIGAFNCNGDRFVFVDSDVILNKHALSHYYHASKEQPDAVIVGSYHWLPPLEIDLSAEKMLSDALSFDDFQNQASKLKLLNVDNDSPFGEDIRFKDFTDDLSDLRKGCGLGALSGNISYPKNLFWKLGGFDEMMVGHGGEDAELGLHADKLDADWLFYKKIFGFHIWHPRDQRKNSLEVQGNIAYIDAKYGVGQYANHRKWTDSRDWSDPIHYHKHLGAKLVKVADDPTVSVWREGHYLKLASVKWLIKLGFGWNDMDIVDKQFLLDAQHCGDILDEEPNTAINAVYEKPSVATLEPAPIADRVFDYDPKSVVSYKKANGAYLVRKSNDSTVFVMRDDNRMGLSHPDWIAQLGFFVDDIAVVPDAVVDNAIDCGATPDRSKIYTGEIKL